MDTIVEILIEAGYFRARINTLSDFDKIIGAIAWALQFFSYDININIFYADTLDLGQKIALTERLVMVLIAMKCPHPIEPHQIVGLDYVNLLPVIDWLIKRSAEARREHSAFNRLLALRHFHRVTNTTPARPEWCHVISPARYKQLKAANREESSDLGLEQGSSLRQSDTFDTKLKDSFDPSRHVSLVHMSSLFAAKSDPQLDQPDTDEDDDNQEISMHPQVNESTIIGGEGIHVLDREKYVDDNNYTAEEQAKLHKELDTELLATNQKILNLVKKLDSMPSKMEISQYQKRYVELHQQLISKNKDLKKIYTLFNSLDSTKYYLTKEINLLDSIMSNLGLANSSAKNRDLFLRQLHDIVLQIGGVRDEVTSKLAQLRQKRNQLKEEYYK